MIYSHNDPDLYKTQTIHVFISWTSTTSLLLFLERNLLLKFAFPATCSTLFTKLGANKEFIWRACHFKLSSRKVFLIEK